jgi:hypothetical protein
MNKDPISAGFIELRVKEIFEEVIFSDRELLIDSLNLKYNQLRQ